MKIFQWILIFNYLILLSGCSVSPVARLESKAHQYQFRAITLESDGFQHAVFSNDIKPDSGGILHIYLEGDGTPWKYTHLVADDPTPRNPLMLDLMSKDTQAAAYLGRPCYNGFSKTPPCEALLWTFSRYSESIVSAMSGALNQLKAMSGANRLRLFGHSGGGTLALLIAYVRSDVELVLTLSGNLDTEGWTEYHAYTPLYNSINPARSVQLDSQIRQIHLTAGEDTTVPPALVLDWIREQRNTDFFVFVDFDHTCCWHQIWPQTLEYLQYQIPSASRRFNGYGTLKGVYGPD